MSNTPYVDIPLGPYLPDFGGIPNHETPGYLVDAINVRSTPNGYRGMPTFADVSAGAISGSPPFANVVGACFLTDSKASYFYLATTGKLFEARNNNPSTWEDVSPTSGNAVDGTGDFVRFGQDIVYICDERAPVFKDMSGLLTTDFSNLAGSPPIAACGARVRQHLVLGGLSTDLYAVQTSAIGNHEDWPTPGTADARAKQSISESLNPEYGVITRVLGGEKCGIVMQDNALTRMTYGGGSAVYEFDTFERIEGVGRGAGVTKKPVSDGKRWYWRNETGVYATDGYSVQNLSAGKIEESLFANTISHPNGASLADGCYSSVYDSKRRVLIFGGGQNFDLGGSRYQLLYNVDGGAFSLTNDYDEVGLFPGYHSTNGRASFSLDATSGILRRLDGATGSIALQTGYIEIDPGYSIQLQGAHLLGTGTGSLTLAYKTAATSSACDVSQSGFTSLTAATLGQKKTARATAQYLAFRVTGTGAESQLIRGIRVYYNRAQPST